MIKDLRLHGNLGPVEFFAKEYFDDKGIDASVLEQIREGKELLGVEN